MLQYLVDHAMKNVWCNPDQDNQLIFAAHKITLPYGELNRFRLMNRQVDLPTRGKRYHVYQVGQIQPAALGLLSPAEPWVVEKWVKFSDAINQIKVLVNLYTVDGVCLPRHNAYYMFSNDRALIFAVEIDSKIPIDYEQEQIFVRLYSNAYYQSYRADATEDFLFCKGEKVADMPTILSYQAQIAQFRQRPGHVSCYVNGFMVPDVSPLTATPGDRVEFLYDSSVKYSIVYTVNSLETFNSELDHKYKYLLHATVSGNDTIDYQDDIDIHILNQKPTGAFKGFYYHRNSPDSHRMVTHRDYSIVPDYFQSIATKLLDKCGEAGGDVRAMKLEVLVRNSGYYRPLIYDHNRIFELYKLSDSEVLQAMVGVNSTLDVWKAAKLENCAYTRLMRARQSEVGIQMVQDAYGYNGIAKLVGDTPTRTDLRSDRQTADLPYALQLNSTAFEYDYDGHLIDWHHHTTGSTYEAISSACRTVEVISGQGTDTPEVIFGTNNISLPTYDNYRVYMCFLNDGIPDNVWRDITGSENYRVENNVLIWNDLQYDQFLMIRTDRKFLCYELDVAPVNGNLYFTLAEYEDRGNGLQLTTLPVPMGELDIFMNGKSLINGLDYIVKFPMVHILNRTHLVSPTDTAQQHFVIRYTGFCDSDLKDRLEGDFGFVEHGFLSNNNRFDIRDDKVLRITVDGAFKHRDELEFSEEHSGINLTDADNGKPYQIKDIIVPLKQLVNENTYSLRDKSKVVDKQVSDYMTIKLPEPDRGNVTVIVQRYPLVSPFFSRLINDLQEGLFTENTLMQPLSDTDIIVMCHQYEPLLAFDPVNEENEIDPRFVIIHPHRSETVKALTLYQYRFLLRVIKLYGRELVDLSSFVTLAA